MDPSFTRTSVLELTAFPRETVRQFYDATLAGIQQLISDQRREIRRKHNKEPKVSGY